MSDDRARLLEQFARKTGEQSPVEAVASEGYEPFKVLDRRQLSLHVRPVSNPILIVKYSYMLYALAAPSGRRLDLTFSFLIITVKGRNLQAVADAVGDERCSFIEEFDPKAWPEPKDASAPFIESIECVMARPPETGTTA